MNAGKWLIVGVFLVAIAAAVGAWMLRLRQTNDVLAFWGPENVALISRGSVTAIIRRGPDGEDRKVVSNVRGMPNVRHTLMLDATFDWQRSRDAMVPPWQYSLEFANDGKVLRIDFAAKFSQAWSRRDPQPILQRPLTEQASKYFAKFFAEQFPEGTPQP